MWHDAVRTLAKLHRVDYKAVPGLEKFGKPAGFYNRQIATFGTLNDVQGKVKDVESGETVGKVPYSDAFMAFFQG